MAPNSINDESYFLWIKEFSCEFFEILKNTYFYRTLLVAASAASKTNHICKGDKNKVFIHSLLSGRKILISQERLRVLSWNFGNINKIFIQNIFSALTLKYKVSTHDQNAISQYLSSFTDQVSWKKWVPSFCSTSWHGIKFINCTRNALWPMKLIGEYLQLDQVTLSQNGFWSVHYILDTLLKC